MIIKHLLDRKNTKIFTFVVLVIITVLSLMPLQKLEISAPKGTDKIVHATMYFFLSFLALWSYARSAGESLIIVLLVILYGIIMELLQKYTPINRDGDVFDVLANIVGVLFGVLFQPLLRKAEKLFL